MLLSFDFANPLYISQDNLIDTVKISFRNTNLYMFPADEEKAAIPDGYTITFELPLQLAKGKSTAQTILQTEEPVKGFIGANLFISFCFNISMNILYAMINSLQITAHLPLNNISFTSNAMETFQYLIDIVSFDFFEVKDHVAFGFTQTDAWTYRFALLDYESFNFIENLGSISLFLVVYILWIVVSLALKFTKIEFNKSPWLQRRVGKIYIVQSLFRFFLETYFELLICSVLFIGMLRTRSIWNAADYCSVVTQLIFLVLCAGFAVFLVWFTIYGVKDLAMDKREKLKTWYDWIGREHSHKEHQDTPPNQAHCEEDAYMLVHSKSSK